MPSEKTYWTPPEVAKRLRVSPDRVVAMIKRGELRGIDTSTRPGLKRPRYKVHISDLIAWENGRAVVPPEPPAPRRRRKQDEVDYF